VGVCGARGHTHRVLRWRHPPPPGARPAQGLCYDEPSLDHTAWYCVNSGQKTHRAKGKLPNAWGLFDVLGNLPERVQDFANQWALLPPGPVTDPSGELVSLPGSRIAKGGTSKRLAVDPTRCEPGRGGAAGWSWLWFPPRSHPTSRESLKDRSCRRRPSKCLAAGCTPDGDFVKSQPSQPFDLPVAAQVAQRAPLPATSSAPNCSAQAASPRRRPGRGLASSGRPSGSAAAA
jgi:hypothetical protein